MSPICKQGNKIKEFYIAKRNFKEQIRNMILYEMIIYFRDNPNKIRKEDFYVNFNCGKNPL